MVRTGYIAFVTETGGGQDNDGNTIPSTKTTSDFIECNLMTITKEYKFVVDGQYVQARFVVYVNQDLFDNLDPVINLESVNKVELKDNNSNYIDDFQIQNREYLNLSKRIKIVV